MAVTGRAGAVGWVVIVGLGAFADMAFDLAAFADMASTLEAFDLVASEDSPVLVGIVLPPADIDLVTHTSAALVGTVQGDTHMLVDLLEEEHNLADITEEALHHGGLLSRYEPRPEFQSGVSGLMSWSGILNGMIHHPISLYCTSRCSTRCTR